MRTSDLLTEWAKQPSGFVLIEGKGWVNVQGTAAKYLVDPRRMDDPMAWEQSADRFTQAVASATQWTAEPDTDAMFDDAESPIPLPIAWENKTPEHRPYRRSA